MLMWWFRKYSTPRPALAATVVSSVLIVGVCVVTALPRSVGMSTVPRLSLML